MSGAQWAFFPHSEPVSCLLTESKFFMAYPGVLFLTIYTSSPIEALFKKKKAKISFRLFYRFTKVWTVKL